MTTKWVMTRRPVEIAAILFLSAAVSGFALGVFGFMTWVIIRDPSDAASCPASVWIFYSVLGIVGVLSSLAYVKLIKALFGYLWNSPIPMIREIPSQEKSA